MSELTTRATGALATETEVMKVLRDTLYPGARPESVAMVLSYCKAKGLDPLQKPVHIVPMWVKDATTGQASMRDVVLPGIPLYRIQAARSGAYAGKSEPEFGPDVNRKLGNTPMIFPQWCKVTIERIVGGQVRQFTAKEFFLENYATAKKDIEDPNAMWKKRPYGQLAKCAEAQALRMAFPEETGGEVTGEEMEGKTFAGTTIEQRPEPSKPAARDIPDMDSPEVEEPPAPLWVIYSRKGAKSETEAPPIWTEKWMQMLSGIESHDSPLGVRRAAIIQTLEANRQVFNWMVDRGDGQHVEQVGEAADAALARLADPVEPPQADLDIPNVEF